MKNNKLWVVLAWSCIATLPVALKILGVGQYSWIDATAPLWGPAVVMAIGAAILGAWWTVEKFLSWIDSHG